MIKIITDATLDVNIDYLKQNNIELIPMNYFLDGETFVDDKTLNLKEFYNKIREGKMPTTSMINPMMYEEIFEKHLKDGNDVLYISFSSGLSGSFNSALLAKNNLDSKYSNKVYCLDTQSASAGITIIVERANELINKGETIEKIMTELTLLRDKIFIFVGVDNLFHLERGGRISKAAAVIGSTLNLKPVIKVNEEGRLVSYKKVMGRKKLILTLVELFAKYKDESKHYNVYILHSDCEEDAISLKEKIKNNYNINANILGIGTIIGSHTGAGAIAIIFVANTTKENIK